VRIPEVSFEHLYRLSDKSGLFEHAQITQPRTGHGYCVDDVSRGLLVVARQPEPTDRLNRLGAMYLRFVVAAQDLDGRFHNRRGIDLRWQDEPTLEDCWGRALWGLGSAVRHAPKLASQALAHFDISDCRRSPWPRAMAFAGLGAAEVLRAMPAHAGARSLLADAAAAIGSPHDDADWRWPESRLRYANAALPETLIAAGSLLGDARALDEGLAMLGWLLAVETAGDHLSVTPVDGWHRGEPRPGFDQQPIEVAALADACATAFDVTGEDRWLDGVGLAADWFLGANDVEVALIDPISGGGCDGLERRGRNENQGAESTLALISTFQQAHRLPSRIAV
jgi:hypothetical protein